MKKLAWPFTLVLLGAVLFWRLDLSGKPARAAVFWASVNGIADIQLGVQDNPITVCFVGDAVTSQPGRVQEVVTHLREFQYAANIDFETIYGTPLSEAAQNNISSLKCPVPSEQSNGWDYYHGDIRVMLRYTSAGWNDPTPGNGCFNDAMTGEPDATRTAAKRIDVFWRGVNDVLRHRTWTDWDGDNGWDIGDMEELGGTLTSGPGVASWADDRLSVFVRGLDGGLWHLRYDGSWGNWAPLGGTMNDSPDAVSWGTNRIDVFVRWSDSSLRRIWSTDGGQNWTSWENLGGTLTSAPAAASWASDRLVVFGRGQDNGLWYRRYDGNTWSGWQPLGGALAGAPDATSPGNDWIHVVVRWTDGALRQITSTDGGLTWGSWQNWGGSLSSDPSIAADSTHRLQVYYQGANTSLWQRIWNPTDAKWGDAADQGVNGNDGSYSGGPWNVDMPDRRACEFNLKLGDNHPDTPPGAPPYLNHTLHEFGHALGLSHEHQRFDGDPNCGTGGGSAGLMTPYDRDSVMHYERRKKDKDGNDLFPKCDPEIPGNFGYSGLSAWDRLALHILYPEDDRVAEFVGTTVLRVGEPLNLQSAWLARGANIDVVASNFVWRINGVSEGTDATFTYYPPGAGEYILEFSHDDFLGRHYTYRGPVRVLEPDEFDAQIVAPIAAALPLLYPTYVYLPSADATIKPDDNMTFIFPSGLFSDTVVIDYGKQPPIEAQGRPHVGVFYELRATYLADGQPARILPGQTYSVEASYAQSAVQPGVSEADLALHSWDPEKNPDAPQWEREASSAVDVGTNRVTATPNHFSLWAVLDRIRLYLPVVLR